MDYNYIRFGEDNVFDEQGSTFLALRKVQWLITKDGEKEAQPDESKAKLELRKWRIKPDGSEMADKGFSFLTEEGPHELAKTLINNGYGHTKDILEGLVKRDNFKDTVENFNVPDNSGEFFDMRSLISLSSSSEDIEEDYDQEVSD